MIKNSSAALNFSANFDLDDSDFDEIPADSSRNALLPVTAGIGNAAQTNQAESKSAKTPSDSVRTDNSCSDKPCERPRLEDFISSCPFDVSV